MHILIMKWGLTLLVNHPVYIIYPNRPFIPDIPVQFVVGRRNFMKNELRYIYIYREQGQRNTLYSTSLMIYERKIIFYDTIPNPVVQCVGKRHHSGHVHWAIVKNIINTKYLVTTYKYHQCQSRIQCVQSDII